MDRFVRPVQILQEQDLFQDDEVGVNHPGSEAYIRLRNNGDVVIVAAEGLAIVLSKAQRSITFVGDSIRFLTRAQGGLRWNDKLFNERAGSFHEATFVPADQEQGFNLYRGVEHFIYDEADETGDEEGERPPARLPQATMGHPFPDVQVTDPETGAQVSYAQYYAIYGRPPPFAGGS